MFHRQNKKMKRLVAFFVEVISSESDKSSKRVIAVWAMFLITAIVVVALVRNSVETPIDMMFYALLGFVASVLGIASYQAVQKDRTRTVNPPGGDTPPEEEEEEPIK